LLLYNINKHNYKTMKFNFITKLTRDIEHRKLGGVCSGLAIYFDVDVVIIRLLFIIGLLSAYPFWILYILHWMITPKNQIIF